MTHAFIVATTIGLPTLIGGSLSLLLPRTSSYIRDCEHHAASLQRYALRLAGLSSYIPDNDPPQNAREFWEDSGGLEGLLLRALALRHLTALLQATVRAGERSEAEASEVLEEKHLQIFFTFLAVPEALLCRLWHSLPHHAARLALQYHWAVTLKTYDLCCTAGAPECVFNDGKLL